MDLSVVTLPNGDWLHDQTPEDVAKIVANAEGTIMVTPEPSQEVGGWQKRLLELKD
jgi:hypothetical protein